MGGRVGAGGSSQSGGCSVGCVRGGELPGISMHLGGLGARMGPGVARWAAPMATSRPDQRTSSAVGIAADVRLLDVVRANFVEGESSAGRFASAHFPVIRIDRLLDHEAILAGGH